MSDFFYRQLAKAAQQEKVVPGQTVTLKVDLALAHDGSGPGILQCFAATGKKVSDACRIVVTLDHSFPAPTVNDRVFQRQMDAFARANRIRLFKNGEGVLHQVIAEEESLWPGMIIVGADGHVATAGAFGAIAFTVSAEEFVNATEGCSHRLEVPEQVVISLEGKLRPNVMARDVAMHIADRYADAIAGKAVLLTGATVDSLNISEKMSICNFMPEGGARTALILPQGELKNIDLTINAEDLGPMLAKPGSSASYCRVDQCSDERITAAIAGGCSSGRLDDMKVIADVLAKGEVHPDVTFVVTPGSRNVMESMDKLGISSIIRKSGAVIMPPGCGACPGKHFGVLSADDVAITTTIKNTPGRIGDPNARIFLASPLTVALSAINGRITEPR